VLRVGTAEVTVHKVFVQHLCRTNLWGRWSVGGAKEKSAQVSF
jgi:hypothetical protein